MLTIVLFVVQDVWNNGGSHLAASAAKLSILIAIIALPVAFMWTTEDMGGSFNTAVTLLLILGIALTAIMISAVTGSPFAPADEDNPDIAEEV